MDEEKRGRPKISLTKEELEGAIKSHRFLYKAAESLGVPYPTFLKAKEEFGLGSKYFNETKVDKRLELIDYDNVDEFVSAMLETDKHCVEQIGYDDVYIKIKERCIVGPWGDWHIGGKHTRHGQLGLDTKLIREYSNIYVVLLGDYCDNFLKTGHGGGVYEQVIPVPEQKQRVEYIVRALGDRILGIVMGCHDKWMFDSDGFDFAQYLAKKAKGSWMGLNGIIHLNVGDQLYDIYVTHKCSRWSRDNPSYGLKDISKMKAKVDIVFAGHRHIPSIEHYWNEKDEWITCVRNSSYKATDYWIAHKNLPVSPYYFPCVILDPDEHEIIAFKDLREAVKYL